MTSQGPAAEINHQIKAGRSSRRSRRKWRVCVGVFLVPEHLWAHAERRSHLELLNMLPRRHRCRKLGGKRNAGLLERMFWQSYRRIPRKGHIRRAFQRLSVKRWVLSTSPPFDHTRRMRAVNTSVCHRHRHVRLGRMGVRAAINVGDGYVIPCSLPLFSHLPKVRMDHQCHHRRLTSMRV